MFCAYVPIWQSLASHFFIFLFLGLDSLPPALPSFVKQNSSRSEIPVLPLALFQVFSRLGTHAWTHAFFLAPGSPLFYNPCLISALRCQAACQPLQSRAQTAANGRCARALNLFLFTCALNIHSRIIIDNLSLLHAQDLFHCFICLHLSVSLLNTCVAHRSSLLSICFTGFSACAVIFAPGLLY